MFNPLTTLQFSLLPALIFLTGCVGMNAPYSGNSSKPLEIDLIPVTVDLVSEMAHQSASERLMSYAPIEALNSPNYRYQIGPGDVLLISVPTIVSFNSTNSPSILGEQGQGYLVYDDGTIYLPYSGSVKVGGLSVKEAQEAVVSALSHYLRAPQVVVTIKDFRSQRIMVTGQVEKPGYLPVTDVPMTLIGALSTTGGILERRGSADPRAVSTQSAQLQISPPEFPDLRNVLIKRGGETWKVNVSQILATGEMGADPILINGDTVVVPSTQRANVFMLGEVLRPGLLEINRENTDLADALMTVGGINQQTSNPSRIYVIRGDHNRPTVYQVDAARPDAMLLAQRFPLLPNDVIYVSEAGATRWNRSLQLIMPTVQGLLSTAIIANTVDDLRTQ